MCCVLDRNHQTSILLADMLNFSAYLTPVAAAEESTSQLNQLSELLGRAQARSFDRPSAPACPSQLDIAKIESLMNQRFNDEAVPDRPISFAQRVTPDYRCIGFIDGANEIRRFVLSTSAMREAVMRGGQCTVSDMLIGETVFLCFGKFP